MRDYQQLEAAGWKGRAGGAIALDPAVRGFVDRAVAALANAGQAAVHRLCVGEQTVAAAITLRSGDAGWFWKIAYDERAARASPGVQLALALTQTLQADDTLAQVDSCATADHPMIDHLWRERLGLADHLVAVGPPSARWFPLACALERARRFAEARAKRVLQLSGLTRLRARRGG